MTNSTDYTFGIEIECFVPYGTIEAGAYHCGRQIPSFPTGWNAQHDGSLRGGPMGLSGVEVVSPVLKGIDGLKQVIEVVRKLNEMGARVATCCGFHVHVGFAGNAEQLKKLIHYVANAEKGIFASTGTKRREMGDYCKSIKPWENSLNFSGSISQVGGVAARDRYHLLNITNLVRGFKPTVEFRAFAGTLNILKIVGHIQMAIAFVQRASDMSRATVWNAKPVSKHRGSFRAGGEGQTQLARLFYLLGWTKGRVPHTYGYIDGVEGAPTLKEIKKALMNLAKKYDGSAR